LSHSSQTPFLSGVLSSNYYSLDNSNSTTYRSFTQFTNTTDFLYALSVSNINGTIHYFNAGVKNGTSNTLVILEIIHFM
jgi:hypothetical protein